VLLFRNSQFSKVGLKATVNTPPALLVPTLLVKWHSVNAGLDPPIPAAPPVAAVQLSKKQLVKEALLLM